jgi:hypothetical protein
MFVDQLTKDLARALRAIMAMDVRGHQLQDRLQFTTPGRALLYPARAALSAYDARAAGATPTRLADIPRWQDKHAEYEGMFSDISCAQDEIDALRAVVDALEAQAQATPPAPSMTAHYQVWHSTDSCGEFWNWDDVGQTEYDAAMPDKRRVLYAIAAE